MPFRSEDLTFVISAYQEGPYLPACIESLLCQQPPKRVKIATSTPGPWIEENARKYGLSVSVNPGPFGMSNDFNFAYAQGESALVTVCHQDDLYGKGYLEQVLAGLNRAKDPILAFTDYYEIRQEQRVESNRLLQIKRLMNVPMRPRLFWSSSFVRRLVLRFGNPICCPSVTFVKDKVGLPPFDPDFQNSMDYMAWTRLSKERGAFVYLPEKLVGHRIHPESTTSQNIANQARSREDLAILKMYWPEPLARLIFRFYQKSQGSNDI